MSDIFISYSREDRETVKRIAAILEEQRWSVWCDRRIPPGRDFYKTIETALDNSKCAIVVWSRNSVASSWVRDEASMAQKRGKALIPVLVERVEQPLGFGTLQAANLVEWRSGIDDLLTSVAGAQSGTTPKKSAVRSAPAWGRERGIASGALAFSQRFCVLMSLLGVAVLIAQGVAPSGSPDMPANVLIGLFLMFVFGFAGYGLWRYRRRA
jgi:hypothetical protein